MASSIERVFVAGAGLMGHGIAQVHAAIGLPVTLYEPDLARAEAGRDRIASNLDRAVAKGRLSQEEREATLARVEPTARVVVGQQVSLFPDPERIHLFDQKTGISLLS